MATEEMGKTLGNKLWLYKNEDNIKALFPEEWTSFKKVNPLKIGVGLEALGIGILSTSELHVALSHLERIKLVLRCGNHVRRNPKSIFTIVKPENTEQNANVAPIGKN